MEFRKMRRSRQQLTDEECVSVLTKEKRGFLAVNGDGGYPYAVPLDYFYDEISGNIYFHCAMSGHKLDAINADSRVCFTVCEQGVQREDWSYHARSVVIFGSAKIITDEAQKTQLVRRLAQKYYPSDAADDIEADIKKNISRMYMVEISPTHMTGKQVHEK